MQKRVIGIMITEKRRHELFREKVANWPGLEIIEEEVYNNDAEAVLFQVQYDKTSDLFYLGSEFGRVCLEELMGIY